MDGNAEGSQKQKSNTSVNLVCMPVRFKRKAGMKNILTYNEMLTDVVATILRLRDSMTIDQRKEYVLGEKVGFSVSDIERRLALASRLSAYEYRTFHMQIIHGVVHLIDRPTGCGSVDLEAKSSILSICWRERTLGVWVKAEHYI